MNFWRQIKANSVIALYVTALGVAALGVSGCAVGREIKDRSGSGIDRNRTQESHQHSFRIAFGSCAQDSSSDIWDQISYVEPDLVLLLGDNVYFENAGHQAREELEQRYDKLFSNPSFQRMRRVFQTYAVWDDHDFGPNNSDSTHSYADDARQLFLKYWNLPESEVALSNTIAQRRVISGIKILLADNRSARINPDNNSRSPTMFGEKQLRWLETELRQPGFPLTILASGGQLLTDPTGYEGLRQYPAEQTRLLAAIASAPGAVVVLSGDRHYAEILERELGNKRVAELTSSPLSGFVAHKRIPNAQSARRALNIGEQNFAILEVTPKEPAESSATSLKAHFLNSNGEAILAHSWEPLTSVYIDHR